MDLHDLVSFAQFKKSEKKTHGGALSSVKLQVNPPISLFLTKLTQKSLK